MEIKIEKNVPITRKAKNGKRKSQLRVALESMEVGDSFLYSIKESRQSVQSMISHVKECQEKEFVTAHVENDIRRVWRVS